MSTKKKQLTLVIALAVVIGLLVWQLWGLVGSDLGPKKSTAAKKTLVKKLTSHTPVPSQWKQKVIVSPAEKQYLQLAAKIQKAKMRHQLLQQEVAIAQAQKKLALSHQQTMNLSSAGTDDLSAWSGDVSTHAGDLHLLYLAQVEGGGWQATLQNGSEMVRVQQGSGLGNGRLVTAISAHGLWLKDSKGKRWLGFAGELVPVQETKLAARVKKAWIASPVARKDGKSAVVTSSHDRKGVVAHHAAPHVVVAKHLPPSVVASHASHPPVVARKRSDRSNPEKKVTGLPRRHVVTPHKDGEGVVVVAKHLPPSVVARKRSDRSKPEKKVTGLPRHVVAPRKDGKSVVVGTKHLPPSVVARKRSDRSKPEKKVTGLPRRHVVTPHKDGEGVVVGTKHLPPSVVARKRSDRSKPEKKVTGLPRRHVVAPRKDGKSVVVGTKHLHPPVVASHSVARQASPSKALPTKQKVSVTFPLKKSHALSSDEMMFLEQPSEGVTLLTPANHDSAQLKKLATNQQVAGSYELTINGRKQLALGLFKTASTARLKALAFQQGQPGLKIVPMNIKLLQESVLHGWPALAS
jgi:IMP cyclohydrolase